MQRLRERPGTALPDGQGGYVTKHQSLLLTDYLSDDPPAFIDVQAEADAARGPVPPFTNSHE